MFKKLICLLKGHKKVKTVYESESNFTNKETAMIAKLVGAEPKGNSLERYPEEKAKWVVCESPLLAVRERTTQLARDSGIDSQIPLLTKVYRQRYVLLY